MAGSRRSAPIETQIFVSGFAVVLAAILFLYLDQLMQAGHPQEKD